MWTFVVHRLVRAVFGCLGIPLITFTLLPRGGRPGPLWGQYAVFLRDAVRGDFGDSLFTQESALALILERMPATLELTFAGMAVGLLIAIPLGVVSAIRRAAGAARLCTVGAVTGQAMPIFWLGIIPIIAFAVQLRVLPASGRGTLAHLVLPAITLGAYLAPLTMRLTRSGMLDVLTQDYIRTARAKGVGEARPPLPASPPGPRAPIGGAALAVAFSMVLGVLMGLLAGFFRGTVDAVVSNFVDVMLAFPFLLLALAAVAALGPGFGNMIVVLGLTGWPIYPRVVRAQTPKNREREFVLAARALGVGSVRILRAHVFPNLVNTIIVMASLEVARMIILESFLSFLRLGIQPPTPSWGSRLGEGGVS